MHRILLIDDYESDLLFTRLMLERCDRDYEVLEHDSAQEALQYLQDHPAHGIAVILLDINMPGMNGFEFLQAYEALDSHLKAQAVVMLSSSPDPREQQRALAFGSVRGFVTKPLSQTSANNLVNLLAPAPRPALPHPA